MIDFDGFSEFEVKQSTVKFENESNAEPLGCVGKLSENLNAKTVTKKCEGVTVKSRTRGDGTGELGFTLHIKESAFEKMFGMKTTGLKAGVRSYGRDSRHKEFCYTAKVLDEDGNVKYKAYPRCCVTSGISRETENGAEEVAEIEVTASVMPDETGQGMYEAFADDLDEVTASQWLENFSPSLVADIDTFAVSMTVTPAESAKVTIVNAEGNSVGSCNVDESGVVTIPRLENGIYTYIVYAEGYTPKTGTITVESAPVNVGSVALTSV